VKVLDSLWAHKGDRRVGELLEARGCELAVPSGVLLPGLFSPIEEAFSKLKALL